MPSPSECSSLAEVRAEIDRIDRAVIALAILTGMMVVASLEWLPMLHASMLAGGLLLATRCVTASAARASVEWNVIIAVAAAFALGVAVEKTGVAKALAVTLTSAAGGDAWLSLVGIYACTLLLTVVIARQSRK